MENSLQYYLLKVIILIKGIKESFDCDPIDFVRIRESDIHHPKSKFFSSKSVKVISVANTRITECKKDEKARRLVVLIHGGAFVSGPTKLHWDVVKKLSSLTRHAIWLCDYPKSPEYKIDEISRNIDLVYEKALKEYKSENITLIGDSVGGTLVMALVQRLLFKNMPIPKKIILISPVCDATFSNPSIPVFESKDIMLSLKGVKSAKKMSAGHTKLENSIISPVNGSFRYFPKTIMFLAEHDITFPDQILVANKLVFAQVEHKIFIGHGMPHIWPFLPIMPESKKALSEIIREINLD
ncbi:alpha/beta hydrolase [Sediminibacterium salmoneum]|uniref:alpha/beta hydrolase n=1 Tax=Sediminibacterium salmoneum TaxID=426421 RepID=UPI00047E0E58|nr:alpha/beta hydrolase [Sediminibacterium salmoneum]